MPDADPESGPKRLGAEYYLNLLRGQIDITRVPFSDRGSRLVIQQEAGRNCLSIRLAERLTILDPDPEAYRTRPPFIQELQFVDEHGEALAFEACASPDGIRFQTRLGEFNLLFQDEQTIAIGPPAGIATGIKFMWNSAHFCIIEIDGKMVPIRNLVYATNCKILREECTVQPGGSTIEYVVDAATDGTILLQIGNTNSPPIDISPFSFLQKSAADRWQAWFERVPPVAEVYAAKYAYAWWVMANNLISPLGCIAYEAMAPSKASYVGLWLWDSALHAIAHRHIDPELARNQIRAFLITQRNDGMLPDAIYDEGVVFEIDHPLYCEVTKPPVLAWAALKIHGSVPNLQFIREIYEPLKCCNNWWFEKNDDDRDGLVQYNHPYSSGLDDNPIWDHGLPAVSPDINTHLYIQMQSLACMADILGQHEDSILWQGKAERLLQQMVTILWDEEAGLFHAFSNGQRIPVITPLNLLPLWTGHLPESMSDRLLANLTDTKKFWGRYMLPTVSRDDPAFDPETMWRGPVWANINYFFIEALQQIGKTDLARDLRDVTLGMIMSQPSIYEYYNADTGVPPAGSVPTFGWTAAVFIDLAIQATLERNANKDGISVADQLM